MEKSTKYMIIALFLFLGALLAVFFFPKDIGGWSSAMCINEEGEYVECESYYWCDCLGFEANSPIPTWEGANFVCYGWLVNCSYDEMKEFWGINEEETQEYDTSASVDMKVPDTITYEYWFDEDKGETVKYTPFFNLTMSNPQNVPIIIYEYFVLSRAPPDNTYIGDFGIVGIEGDVYVYRPGMENTDYAEYELEANSEKEYTFRIENIEEGEYVIRLKKHAVNSKSFEDCPGVSNSFEIIGAD